MATTILNKKESAHGFRLRQYHLILSCFILFGLGLNKINAQGTTLAAGDIAFTGYHSNTAVNDSFSFVLLKAVNAGTLINFTDNGWLNPGVFRAGETHITLTFSSAQPAGIEITMGLFTGGGTARISGSGASAGTVTLTAGPNPMSLSTVGDQILAYQGTIAAPVFISGIHMNIYSTDVAECACSTPGAWDPDCIDGAGGTVGNANFSKIPLGLISGTNALFFPTPCVNASDRDNAVFTGCGLDLSTPAAVRTAVNNSANWTTSNNTNRPGFFLGSNCPFLAAPCSITLSSAAGTNAQTVCINTAITSITYTTTSATGATFSGLPAGVTGIWSSNTVTISGTPTTTVGSPFSYTVTLMGGSCIAQSATGTITVTPANTVTLTSGAGTNIQTVIVSTPISNITYSTTIATGATFSGLPPGVTGNWAANVATISGTPNTIGTYNYTITLTGGCNGGSTGGQIVVQPIGTCSYLLTSAVGTDNQGICLTAPIINITYSTTGVTGIFAATGLPGGVSANWAANLLTISGTPTAAGVFNYQVPLNGPYCYYGTGYYYVAGTITVNQLSVAPTGATGLTTICSGNSTFLTVTGGFKGFGCNTEWFTGSCGGTPVFIGDAFSTGPLYVNTTYFVRYNGPCNTTTCATVAVTVSPEPTAIATPSSQTICSSSAITTIALTGAVSGTIFNWTRDNTVSVTGIAASGSGNISGSLTNTTNAPVTVTFTITPVANGCNGTPVTATITIIPTPSVNSVSNKSYCDGAVVPSIVFSSPVAGSTFSWSRTVPTPDIGLGATSGTGNVPSFTASNTSNTPITSTFTVTASYTNNGVTCTGNPIQFTITVAKPNTTLAGTAGSAPVSQTLNVAGSFVIFNDGCNLFSKLAPSGASPVNGNVTGKVWIENSVPLFGSWPYVARHFEMQPATNPSTATGTITLYFLQSEFDAFNANATSVLNLPTNTADATGKANLRIYKYPGTSSDGSGLPYTYSGTAVLIDPVDANIVWNATSNWWEVTFDVTGFSGYTVGTSNTLNFCANGSFIIPAGATGTTYQWVLDNGTGYAPIVNGPYYSGVTTATLTLIALPTNFYGYKYRCYVNGVPSTEYDAKFVAIWQGNSNPGWIVASNWGVCGVVPDQFTDVVIPSGRTNYPVVSANTTIRSLRNDSGSAVTVQTGVNLIIIGH